MKVKDLLKKKELNIYTSQKSDKIVTAMEQLISKKVSCLPVIEDERLIGIISDKDIFKAVFTNQTGFTEMHIDQIMSTNLIVGVEDDDIEYISSLMTNNRIRHIPIVDGEKLIGLVSIGDVVKAREKDIKYENRYLKQYIDGSYPG